MKYHEILVLLVTVCCMNTHTRLSLSAEVTNRTCACSMGSCNFNRVCSPTPNCTRENVALGKPASMSSFWVDVESSGPACLAVNGNTDTIYRNRNQPTPNCIHTGYNDRNAYWLVNLGRSYTIKNITVYIRSSNPARMDLVSITVDDQPCYQFPNNHDYPFQNDVSCNTPRRGSVVQFYKNGANQPEHMLNICEVQVWVCTPGLYGINCDNKCNCKDDENCDNFYGTCTHGCKGRFYGSNCTQECGNCNESTACDFQTGECLNGCKSGWQEPMCTVCRNESYGSDCSNTCGSCRGSLPCNATNGTCLNGCLDGFIGSLCIEKCKTGFYGTNCNSSCGFCKDSQPCHWENGTCAGGCADGFKAPDCIEKCPLGTWGKLCKGVCGNCNGSACRNDNGTCETGCIPGFVGDLCTVSLDQRSDGLETRRVIGATIGAGLFLGACILVAVLIWCRIRKSRLVQNNTGRKSGENNPQFDGLEMCGNSAMGNIRNPKSVYEKPENEKEENKSYVVLNTKKQNNEYINYEEPSSLYHIMS